MGRCALVWHSLQAVPAHTRAAVGEPCRPGWSPASGRSPIPARRQTQDPAASGARRRPALVPKPPTSLRRLAAAHQRAGTPAPLLRVRGRLPRRERVLTTMTARTTTRPTRRTTRRTTPPTARRTTAASRCRGRPPRARYLPSLSPRRCASSRTASSPREKLGGGLLSVVLPPPRRSGGGAPVRTQVAAAQRVGQRALRAANPQGAALLGSLLAECHVGGCQVPR